MKLVGQAVKHIKFGKGVITKAEDSFVTVLFADCEKKFMYPDAFSKYLTLKDDDLQEEVYEEYEQEMEEIEAEKEKRIERQDRIDHLRSIKNTENSQAVFNLSDAKANEALKKGELFTGCYASGERKGRAKIATRIKPNSCCIITDLKDKENEEERVITGLMMVDESFYGTLSTDGILKCHPKYKVFLQKSARLKIWDYLSHSKGIPNWGSSEFKYLSSSAVHMIIHDIAQHFIGTKDEQLMRDFYKYYCITNHFTEKEL